MINRKKKKMKELLLSSHKRNIYVTKIRDKLIAQSIKEGSIKENLKEESFNSSKESNNYEIDLNRDNSEKFIQTKDIILTQRKLIKMRVKRLKNTINTGTLGNKETFSRNTQHAFSTLTNSIEKIQSNRKGNQNSYRTNKGIAYNTTNPFFTINSTNLKSTIISTGESDLNSKPNFYLKKYSSLNLKENFETSDCDEKFKKYHEKYGFTYKNEDFHKNVMDIFNRIDYHPKDNKKAQTQKYTQLKKFEKFKKATLAEDNVNLVFNS